MDAARGVVRRSCADAPEVLSGTEAVYWENSPTSEAYVCYYQGLKAGQTGAYECQIDLALHRRDREPCGSTNPKLFFPEDISKDSVERQYRG
jgi:hypothetical protein